MNFVKKNFVTILVVGATVVLAGVAMFTALRLYSLRQNPVTPNVPASTPGASDAPIGVRPTSGNWNLPEKFILTNTSNESVDLVWKVDCWDENLCEDSSGTETLAPGDSLEKGLGSICSQWQLNVNWTGTGQEDGDVWDFSQVSELGAQCDIKLDTQATATPVSAQASQSANLTSNTTESTGEIETVACSAFNFILSETPAATSTATPKASTIATATPTVRPSATATPVSTSSATPKPTATPQLPNAGVSVPTVLGLMSGGILLLLAIGLAF